MELPAPARRVVAIAISVTLASALMWLPVVGSARGVFGTLRAAGPAWVASGEGEWSPVESTRPFVLGDRLRTGPDGYLLADLGGAGAIGLFADAEVTADASAPVIDVRAGKVAFRLAAASPMRLTASRAGIVSDAMPAAGYVEYRDDGVPVVVGEQGRVNVRMDGMLYTIVDGEKLALKAGEMPGEAIEEPVSEEPAEEAESKKAAAAPVEGEEEPKRRLAGISATGWTAIAAIAGLTGGSIALAESGGGSDDSNGSPDGE